MTKEVKKERNTSIEILRIIAMIMIILSHNSVHGNYNQLVIPFYNQFFLQLIVLGNLGVDIFMLISGYYMVESKFSIKKVIKLLFQVLFYSYGFYLLLVFNNIIPFSYKTLIKSFFPTIFGEYWFFTAYLIIYLFSPYINSFLKNLHQKEYKSFLILFIVIWSVISLFVPNFLSSSPLIDTFVFYSIGAYLKLHTNTIMKKKRIGNIFAIGSILILLITTFICTFFRFKYSLFDVLINRLYFRSSPVILLLAIGIFVIFLNKKVKCNHFINDIASLTFGVYLIHDNNNIRYFLWNNLFQNNLYGDSIWLIFMTILSTFIIFAFSIIIEFLRKKYIEQNMESIFLWLEKTINSVMKKIEAKIKKIIDFYL